MRTTMLLVGAGVEGDEYRVDLPTYSDLRVDVSQSLASVDVPAGFKTADGFRFGRWVVRQRGAYRRGTLSEERIAHLEAVGWYGMLAR